MPSLWRKPRRSRCWILTATRSPGSQGQRRERSMMMRTTLSLRAAVTTDPRRRRGAGQTQKITRTGRGAGRKRGKGLDEGVVILTMKGALAGRRGRSRVRKGSDSLRNSDGKFAPRPSSPLVKTQIRMAGRNLKLRLAVEVRMRQQKVWVKEGG